MEEATREREFRPYQPPGEDKPLGGYAALIGVWSTTFVAALVASRDRLPERVPPRDLALLTVATHKLSRLIAKDKVTSPVRAPFTEYQEDAGPSEVDETPRGSGLRKATGELLSCPFCVAQWVGAAGLFGLVYAPRATRFTASLFAIVSGSDFLQIAYKAAQDKNL